MQSIRQEDNRDASCRFSKRSNWKFCELGQEGVFYALFFDIDRGVKHQVACLMLIENHAGRGCPFRDFLTLAKRHANGFVLLLFYTNYAFVSRSSKLVWIFIESIFCSFYSFCPFLSLFVLFFNLASINRRNGRRYQHVLALYVFCLFVCLLLLFLSRITLKGLTLENVFSCLCMYAWFVLGSCMGWICGFCCKRERVCILLWEEFWNMHLIMTEFNRPEVPKWGWQHVKIQSLTIHTFLKNLASFCTFGIGWLLYVHRNH